MTSLPMPSCVSGPAPVVPACLVTGPASEDEQFLLRAFRSFAAAASSLELSYGRLRAEVERLNQELAKSNAGLAESLEQNRSMREYLDRILESLPCGVLVVESDGAISRLNPEAIRLLEWGPDSPPARCSLRSLDLDLRRLLERARDAADEAEQRFAGAAGSVRWLAARHATVAAVEGGTSVFILRDVSERKRLEEAQARLRRDEVLAEMSAVLAHEIRNPLGSLELFAGLLAESELAPDCREWVQQVQAGLRSLAATVNNVLHFHSLPEIERAPLDLGHLLDWVRDFFAPLARREHVEICLHNRLAGVSFPADRHRLEQVFANLVLNAVRALQGAGRIGVAGERMGECATIVVEDTGPGIAPEQMARIFEPGFTTRPGSPGLGLAVCRRIVGLHGGTIEVASSASAGARFILRFPLVPDVQTSKGAE